MSWDDEYDEEHDEALEYDDSDFDASGSNDILEESKSKEDFDPLDITNPVSAYLFLSDDVQDDLQGSDKRKMKCLSCGHRFMGEISDVCPECLSPNTEEAEGEADDIQGDEKHRMKCVSCGHKFIGEIYDDCPECFSADTAEIIDNIGDEEDELF